MPLLESAKTSNHRPTRTTCRRLFSDQLCTFSSHVYSLVERERAAGLSLSGCAGSDGGRSEPEAYRGESSWGPRWRRYYRRLLRRVFIGGRLSWARLPMAPQILLVQLLQEGIPIGASSRRPRERTPERPSQAEAVRRCPD